MNVNPGDHVGAERRYSELRRLAYKDAQLELAGVAPPFEARPLNATAMESLRHWRDRRVHWPWPEMADDYRRGHPDRLEVSLWCRGMLCGVGLGRPSSSPLHAALHYIEGNPMSDHPLRGRVTLVMVAVLRSYAITLGKKEMRLVDPLPALIPFYCGPPLGFDLVRPKREAPYCRRSISDERSIPP